MNPENITHNDASQRSLEGITHNDGRFCSQPDCHWDWWPKAKNQSSSIQDEIRAQKKIEAGHDAATRIAQHAHELIQQGHSEAMAHLKAKAALPQHVTAHETAMAHQAEMAEKKKALDEQNAHAAKVYALMDSEKIPYGEAWRRLINELPDSMK